MAGVKGMEVKYKPFKAALNRLLDQADKHHAGPKKWDDIALALYKRAKAGDVQAIKEIADRTDGKVPQSIGGDAELGPIGVVVTGVIRADDEPLQIEGLTLKELADRLDGSDEPVRPYPVKDG